MLQVCRGFVNCRGYKVNGISASVSKLDKLQATVGVLLKMNILLNLIQKLLFSNFLSNK
jgi:hypothetical protein